MFKTDRSHSEVGDTLRYFNSVAPSRSWCGEESYFGGKSNSKLRKNKYKKKLRSNSSSSQYLKSSQPTLELAIRNNSIAGYQFDTILDDVSVAVDDLVPLSLDPNHPLLEGLAKNDGQILSVIDTPTRGERSPSLAGAPHSSVALDREFGYNRQISKSAPHSHQNSREVIAIVLHPPDDEDDQMAHSESRRNRNMILFHGKGGRRSTSLDIDDKSTCQIRTGPGPSNARFRKASDVLPLPLSSIPSPQPSPSTSEVLTKSESDSVYYRRASFVPVQITSNPMNRGSSDASLKSAPPHVPHVASCPLMEEEILQHDNEISSSSVEVVPIEASETGAAIAVAIPAHVLSAFNKEARKKHDRKRRKRPGRVIVKAAKTIKPSRWWTRWSKGNDSDCEDSANSTSSHSTCSDSEIGSSGESRLDLIDTELETAHKGIMARTRQKYLIMDTSSFPDKCFTGSLICLTMMTILVLFWYQNFGDGFHHLKQD